MNIYPAKKEFQWTCVKYLMSQIQSLAFSSGIFSEIVKAIEWRNTLSNDIAEELVK